MTYQSCPPPSELDFPLLAPDVDVGLEPSPSTCFTFAQNPVYQLRMELRLAGASVQALSHTPAVPWLKAVRRGSPQKQASYTEAAAVGFAGGTQAPLTSKRGPHCLAQAGRVERGKSVVSVDHVS